MTGMSDFRMFSCLSCPTYVGIMTKATKTNTPITIHLISALTSSTTSFLFAKYSRVSRILTGPQTVLSHSQGEESNNMGLFNTLGGLEMKLKIDRRKR